MADSAAQSIRMVAIGGTPRTPCPNHQRMLCWLDEPPRDLQAVQPTRSPPAYRAQRAAACRLCGPLPPRHQPCVLIYCTRRRQDATATYGGRGRTASLLALVGELAGARGCEGAGGRDRLFIKRLLARRDRHRLEHVIFVQRVKRVVVVHVRLLVDLGGQQRPREVVLPCQEAHVGHVKLVAASLRPDDCEA